jgi:hypothetical protein
MSEMNKVSSKLFDNNDNNDDEFRFSLSIFEIYLGGVETNIVRNDQTIGIFFRLRHFGNFLKKTLKFI